MTNSWWTAIDRRLNSPASRRGLIFIFLIIAFILSILPVLHCFREQGTLDYRLWYEAGQRVLAGGDIYFAPKREYDFIYPPTCALFLAALGFLGQCGFILALVTINSIAWFLSARLAAKLATGDSGKPNTWLYFVPSFLVMVSIWSNYHLGQPSLVLLALMLGAFVSLRSKREIAGGALFAIAAAIKAFPIVAIVYLVYRRYWKPAASLILTLAFLLFLLPAPFRGGFQRAWRDLEKWRTGMFTYDARGIGQRPGRSQTWKNQSIVGVANRLLRSVDIDDTTPPDQPAYINVVSLKFSSVNLVIASVTLLLGMIFLAVMPRQRQRTPSTDALEFSLLLLLMLMLTPLTYQYSFAFLMLPFAVVTRRVIAGSEAILWWGISAYALFLITLISPRIAQAYGSFFFGALILFVGLAVELWRDKHRLYVSMAD